MAEIHRVDDVDFVDPRQGLAIYNKAEARQRLFLKIAINILWFLAGFFIIAIASGISQQSQNKLPPPTKTTQRTNNAPIPSLPTIPLCPPCIQNPPPIQPAPTTPTSATSATSPASLEYYVGFQEVLNKDPALKQRLAREALAREEKVKRSLIKSVIIDYYKEQMVRLDRELGYKRQNEIQIRKQCTKTAITYQSGHWYGPGMKNLLKDIYDRKGAKIIADLGCGKCEYVDDLRRMGYEAYGYEFTIFNHNDYIKKMDLSQKTDLGKMFDFVQSFEVGEHIYSVYEDTFIDNIVSHARLGIVLSWSIWGQVGFMHVNSRDNEYIIRKVEDRGFTYQPDEAYKFRKEYTNHFADTIMVFFKN